jgi:aminomethyltransferase
VGWPSRAARDADRKKRVGLELAAAASPRPQIFVETVRSAASLPDFLTTIEKSIAMAYIDWAYAAIGTPVEVDIRGKRESAIVAKLPFYTRKS